MNYYIKKAKGYTKCVLCGRNIWKEQYYLCAVKLDDIIICYCKRCGLAILQLKIKKFKELKKQLREAK